MDDRKGRQVSPCQSHDLKLVENHKRFLRQSGFKVLLFTDGLIEFLECAAEWIVEEFRYQIDPSGSLSSGELFGLITPGNLDFIGPRIFHDEEEAIEILVKGGKIR